MKEILITAFEPFGGRERNASSEVLRFLPDEIGGNRVRKMLLPVAFGKAAGLVLRESADAVFLLGEAGGRSTVTPELRAVNIRDARIPDNADCRPVREKILEDGPKAYHTRIPVKRIAVQMQESGYPIGVSADAGTFVCNDVFYSVGTALDIPVSFIHCPADADRAAAYADVIREFIRRALKAEQTIAACREYIGGLFRGNADGHGLDHTMRVYRNAMEIADTEPEADRYIVSLGALLHDADDAKLFQTGNNANARDFLASQQTDPETADEIIRVINGVSFSRNGDRRPETTEGQIVQDADRLDAMGAVGIARTFAYGGRHGRTMQDSIRHFHEKLLLLKDRMNTAKGKEMADARHAFLAAFLEEWEKEVQPG